MIKRFRVWLLASLVITALGCDRTVAPSGTFTGTWSGTVSEIPRGPGAIRLTLDHRGAVIDGTLRTTFQNVVDREGRVSGTASAGTATLTFVPGQPFECGAAGTLTGTVTLTLSVNAGRLSGSYAQFTCAGAVTATVDMTKE
jgi:hypothetical protein